ncbi:sulfatase-like hydrolase/transferase [Rhodopirellula sp. P2]|uniref:sulfatase-like hydrolase/transferase n=1 Tax=Rhodopirellula sp. P2 TaxID=2127060 RepID=UPI003FD2A963
MRNRRARALPLRHLLFTWSLANEGVMFTQAYVSHPCCGPTRMALLSGRMPHCFGGQKSWIENGMPKFEQTFQLR